MFEIHNKRKQFWQWDTGQRLIVNADMCSEVHFCNGTSDCSMVCRVYEEDGLRLVNVPNILLQMPKAIRAFVYVCDEEDHHTERSVVFPVFPRSKPEDYVYTETEVKKYEALEGRIKDLEENSGSGTVKSVNGNTPDESGNVEISTLTDEDALALVTETGLVDPATDENGKFFTDGNGVIFVL